MRLQTAMLAATLLCGGCLSASTQTSTDPPLRHRSSSTDATTAPDAATHSTGRSTLPPDASGEYLIDESGSTIEITLDEGRLSGYVTRMGDEQSDKTTPLTLFFDQVTAKGQQLTFTTKKVHGIWYEFSGTIERGDSRTTRSENGYYLLKGWWTVHNDAGKTQSRDEVIFKSTPRPQAF